MSEKYLALKQEIIAACLWLEEKGFVVGTYGNVSVRVPEGLIITPSRTDYQAMTPEDLVLMSLDGRVLAGARFPSSELEVHRQVYLVRRDVQSVVHTHSLYSAAVACLHATIPPLVEEQSQVLGSEIRCTRYVPAGQHQQLGAETARTLGNDVAILLANHGGVTCGRNLQETLFATQVVERVAQMYLLTRAAGGAIPIPQEFVTGERERYLHKYGKAEDNVLAAS
jgi:L-fuculose-phosphate aldolase